MLQRIQSVFLALIVVFHLLLLFIPCMAWTIAGQPIQLTALRLDGSAGVPWLILIPNILIIISTLLTIFQFKDRKRQLKLGKLILIDLVLFIGGMVFYYMQVPASNSAVTPEFAPQHGFGMVFPLISLILLWLAMRAIRKDEELVRSVDRIR